MSKTKSFVCYGRVVAGGMQQVLYRTAVTPGDDAIAKNLPAPQNVAQFVTYLSNLVTTNTLMTVAEIAPAATTALTDLVTAHVAARQAGLKNRIKVALVRVSEGAQAGVPGLLITQTINNAKVVQTIPLVA